MITVQTGMHVAKQARKFDTRITHAHSTDAAAYLAYLKDRMLASVALGVPQPASNWLPRFEEEFE